MLLMPSNNCCSCFLFFPQHKVLLQQFNTGDERTQKRLPVRGSDEGEGSLSTHDHVVYFKSQ